MFLAIGLIIPIIIVFTTYVKKDIENNYLKVLSNQLIYIENIIGGGNNIISIKSVLDDISKINGYELRLTVISNNGQVIHDSKKDPTELDNHASRPEFISANSGKIGAEIRYSKSIKMDMMYVAKKAPDGTINRLSIPLDFIEEKSSRVITQIIQFAIIVLLFSIFMTIAMTRWSAQSLNWILDTIHKVKDKRFNEITQKGSIINEVNEVKLRLYEVSMDIQQSLKKISKEKEKKDIILNNMINGLIVTNKNSEIKLMNQAAYKLFFDLPKMNNRISLLDYPKILNYSKELFDKLSIEPLELCHKNGSVILVTGSIYLEGKSPQGILVAQDITKLKKLELTRQQFVANVSHELKTPITYIRSLIETMLSAKEKDIDLDNDFIKKALGHCDRLSNIINDLLQLSKLEFGEVQKQPVKISTIIDAVIQESVIQADKKNIELLNDSSQSVINCNFSLMIQALKNLIDNAIKFSYENSKVEIQCDEQESTIDINVIDYGAGIDEKHVSKLFQRFYRVDTARSRQLGGTGLGLSIVKHIAQSHGGEAFVKSKIKKGSVFTIRLPK